MDHHERAYKSKHLHQCEHVPFGVKNKVGRGEFWLRCMTGRLRFQLPATCLFVGRRRCTPSNILTSVRGLCHRETVGVDQYARTQPGEQTFLKKLESGATLWIRGNVI